MIQNAKAFDLHFISNRAIALKWKTELIMNGLKTLCMKMENSVFLDSVSFLPFTLRKLLEAFGLSPTKLWYPQHFNAKENLECIGPIPDVSYHGVNETGKEERRQFLAYYDKSEKSVEPFKNR